MDSSCTQFPISLENFMKCTYYEELVDSLLETKSEALELLGMNIKSDYTRTQILQKYYESFYLNPAIRQKFPIRFRPLPRHRKETILKVPTMVKTAECNNIPTSAKSAKRSAESFPQSRHTSIPDKRPKIGVPDEAKDMESGDNNNNNVKLRENSSSYKIPNITEVSSKQPIVTKISSSSTQDNNNSDEHFDLSVLKKLAHLCPVTLSHFKKYTNITALMTKLVAERYENPQAHLRKLTKRFYLSYYLYPRVRNYDPMCHLQVNSNCPVILKRTIFEIPKQPSGTVISVEVNESINKSPKTSSGCNGSVSIGSKDGCDNIVPKSMPTENSKPSTIVYPDVYSSKSTTTIGTNHIKRNTAADPMPAETSQNSTTTLEICKIADNSSECAQGLSSNSKGAQFPVSLANFMKCTYYEELVDSLLETKSQALELLGMNIKSDYTRTQILQKYYESFYLNPAIRQKFPIRFKPLPRHRKEIILKVPAMVKTVLTSAECNIIPISAISAKRSAESFSQSRHTSIPCKRPKISVPDEAKDMESGDNNNNNVKLPENDKIPYPPEVSSKQPIVIEISSSSAQDNNNSDEHFDLSALKKLAHLCPVSLSQFKKYTNFTALMTKLVAERYENPQAHLRKISKRFYLSYYLYPRVRNYDPMCHLQVNSKCPVILKRTIFEIPKRPSGTVISVEVNESINNSSKTPSGCNGSVSIGSKDGCDNIVPKSMPTDKDKEILENHLLIPNRSISIVSQTSETTGSNTNGIRCKRSLAEVLGTISKSKTWYTQFRLTLLSRIKNRLATLQLPSHSYQIFKESLYFRHCVKKILSEFCGQNAGLLELLLKDAEVCNQMLFYFSIQYFSNSKLRAKYPLIKSIVGNVQKHQEYISEANLPTSAATIAYPVQAANGRLPVALYQTAPQSNIVQSVDIDGKADSNQLAVSSDISPQPTTIPQTLQSKTNTVKLSAAQPNESQSPIKLSVTQLKGSFENSGSNELSTNESVRAVNDSQQSSNLLAPSSTNNTAKPAHNVLPPIEQLRPSHSTKDQSPTASKVTQHKETTRKSCASGLSFKGQTVKSTSLLPPPNSPLSTKNTPQSTNNTQQSSNSSQSGLKNQIENTSASNTTSFHKSSGISGGNKSVNPCLVRAKQVFFQYHTHKYSLPYMLRVSHGVKQRIIEAVFDLSFEDFKAMTHIYKGSDLYNDANTLKQMYKYVFKTQRIWPRNLFIDLKDMCLWLKNKHIAVPEASTILRYVSPRFLHWSNLVNYTNVVECVSSNYVRRLNEIFDVEHKSKVERECDDYYNQCWMLDRWIGEVPKLKATLTDMAILEGNPKGLNSPAIREVSVEKVTGDVVVAENDVVVTNGAKKEIMNETSTLANATVTDSTNDSTDAHFVVIIDNICIAKFVNNRAIAEVSVEQETDEVTNSAPELRSPQAMSSKAVSLRKYDNVKTRLDGTAVVNARSDISDQGGVELATFDPEETVYISNNTEKEITNVVPDLANTVVPESDEFLKTATPDNAVEAKRKVIAYAVFVAENAVVADTPISTNVAKKEMTKETSTLAKATNEAETQSPGPKVLIEDPSYISIPYTENVDGLMSQKQGMSCSADPLQQSMSVDDVDIISLQTDSSNDSTVIFNPCQPIKTEPMLRNLKFVLEDDDTIQCSHISDEIVVLDSSFQSISSSDGMILLPSQIDFGDNDEAAAQGLLTTKSSGDLLSSGSTGSILNFGQRLPSSIDSNETQYHSQQAVIDPVHDIQLRNVNMASSESQSSLLQTPENSPHRLSNVGVNTLEEKTHTFQTQPIAQMYLGGETSFGNLKEAQRFPSTLDETLSVATNNEAMVAYGNQKRETQSAVAIGNNKVKAKAQQVKSTRLDLVPQEAQRFPSTLDETLSVATNNEAMVAYGNQKRETQSAVAIGNNKIKAKAQQVKSTRLDLVPQKAHAYRSLPVVTVIPKPSLKSTAKQAPVDVKSSKATAVTKSTATCDTNQMLLSPQAFVDNLSDFVPGPTSTQTSEQPQPIGSPAAATNCQQSLRVSQELLKDNTLFNSTTLMAAVDRDYSKSKEENLLGVKSTHVVPSRVNNINSAAKYCNSLNPPRKRRNILYRNLIELHYFQSLTSDHISKYQLPTVDYRTSYIQATVSCGNFKTSLSHDSVFTLFPQWSSHLRRDILTVLTDLNEFHYLRFGRSPKDDLRHNILDVFFRTISPFCKAQISYEQNNSYFSNCISLWNSCNCASHLRKPFQSLTHAIQPNVLNRLKILKNDLKNCH